MSLSYEMIQKLKQIFIDDYGVEMTDEETTDSAYRLFRFAELLMKIEQKEIARRAKLKDFPKGYSFDDDNFYNCPICHKSMMNEEIWYDDCGMKCLECQDNLNKKRIPKSVFKKKDSWYSYYGLKSKFGIDEKEAKRLKKEGKLNSRDFISSKGRCYYSVFLKKDNPGLVGK